METFHWKVRPDIAGRGVSEVERHSLGEGYGSRKTVPDPGGGRNKKQPDAGSQ